MSVLEILLHPNPKLREKAEPITEINKEVFKFANDMWETMYHDRGVGLAATQVGVKQRLIVVDVSDKGNEPMCLINPELVDTHGEILGQEGCLSFPGIYIPVGRPETIKVKFLNEHGEEKTLEADGLLSRCIQHEIDHLNGVVFIDHVSRMKRERAMKKYLKELEMHKKVL